MKGIITYTPTSFLEEWGVRSGFDFRHTRKVYSRLRPQLHCDSRRSRADSGTGRTGRSKTTARLWTLSPPASWHCAELTAAYFFRISHLAKFVKHDIFLVSY